MRACFTLILVLASCSPTVLVHGVPNLAQVDPSVWRAGQITTPEGWDWIVGIAAGRKIHVVKLNFDAEGSDAEAVKRGFDVHVLSINPQGDQDLWDDIANAFKTPDPARVRAAEDELAVCVDHPTTDLCLVHCTHGQDRTGLVIGEHRVLHDGWTKSRAYSEMLLHNFHPELHGLHETWERFQPTP